MALYFLQIQAISRGSGRSAVAAAAYRAGERIRDERTGHVHNFSYRRDVLHTELFLPRQIESEAPAWTHERSALWNAAEQLETRRNARVAREFLVTLPPELSPPQRLSLAQGFARDLADRHGVVIDLAVHEPRAGGDPRNHHAHLLATTRELTLNGLGAKAGLDMSDAERARRGLSSEDTEFHAVRALWAEYANEALRSAGRSERLDHRSLRQQGIEREPVPTIPYAALQVERRGGRSEIAERIRAAYLDRAAARAARAATPDVQSTTPEVQSVVAAPVMESLEQVRRQARETWRSMRAASAGNGERTDSARTMERAATSLPDGSER